MRSDITIAMFQKVLYGSDMRNDLESGRDLKQRNQLDYLQQYKRKLISLLFSISRNLDQTMPSIKACTADNLNACRQKQREGPKMCLHTTCPQQSQILNGGTLLHSSFYLPQQPSQDSVDIRSSKTMFLILMNKLVNG